MDEAVLAAGRAFEHVTGRNRARLHMVLVRAHLARGEVAAARGQLVEAQTLLARVGASQYQWELREIEAHVLAAEGYLDAARNAWSALCQDAYRIGHPRTEEYLSALGRLPPPPGLPR